MESSRPQNLSPTRERAAAGLRLAARACFGALLFLSPLAFKVVLAEHRFPPVYTGYTDIQLFPSDIFLILTLAFWLLSRVTWPRPLRRGPWYLTLPLAGLVILSWITVLTGIDHELTFYQSVRFTLLFLLYLYLADEVTSPQWIAVPLGLGVLAQSAVAFAQSAAQRSVGLGMLGELTLNPQDTGTSIVREGSLRVLRAYGLTEHPNLLGGFLAFALILLLGYYLVAAARTRFLLLGVLGLGGIALLLTFSRAATFSFLAGAALLVLAMLASRAARANRLRELAPAALVSLAALALTAWANAPLVEQRLGQNDAFNTNPGEQRSLQERDALIASANRIFYTHELIGVGNGALPVAMLKLDAQFDTEYYYQPAHFVLLDAAAELGLLGGFFWMWLLVLPWIALWIKRQDLVRSPWFAAAAGALLIITLIGFFDYYPWLVEGGRIWQWTAWGLVAQLVTRRGLLAPVSPPGAS